MTAASTRSALANMYKTVYSGRDLTNFSKRKTPLLDLVSKKDDFYGAGLSIPINIGLNHGIYPGLDATNPVATAGRFLNWSVTDTQDLYGRSTIHIPGMLRSSKDIGAWMKLRQKETSELLANMKMQRAIELWGAGTAQIGVIFSVAGGPPLTTITLTNQTDAVHFEKGMVLSFTTSVGVARTDICTVTAVNRYNSAGAAVLTVTTTGGANDVVATDLIYRRYFKDTGLTGLGAWIPSADPDGTSFFGVARNVDPQFLGGWRGTWEGSINESAERLVNVMSQYFQPEFSSLWLSSYRWYQLKEELTAQGRFYKNDLKTMEFGTSTLIMDTSGGPVTVAMDPYCPNDTGWLLKHDEIEIHTTGPFIHLCDEDVEALRMSDDDALEFRWRSLAECVVPRPVYHGRFPISG
jgi:hypothetical protein